MLLPAKHMPATAGPARTQGKLHACCLATDISLQSQEKTFDPDLTPQLLIGTPSRPANPPQLLPIVHHLSTASSAGQGMQCKVAWQNFTT